MKDVDYPDAPGWLDYLNGIMPFPAPELTSALFEDAIEHLEQHGWAQGFDVRDDGSVCARGALAHAKLVFTYATMLSKSYDVGRLELVSVHGREIARLMGIDLGKFGSLMEWNDAKGRTEKEVIDALTLAAKTLRDQGK